MSRKQNGFTIIELMIATMVFSVILLVITTALIQIGHIYYKGITSAKTQEASRGIIDDISRSIQMSGGNVTTSITDNNGSSGFCVNQRRYSFVLNKQLTDNGSLGSDQTHHALVVDNMNNQCTSATPAQDLSGALVSGSDELLEPNMRITRIAVMQTGTDLYTISIRVVYGDTDVLNIDPTYGNTTCINQTAGSQFCAFSELNTTVQKRVQ